MLFPSEVVNSSNAFERMSTVKVTHSSKRFLLQEKFNDYSKQFAHIYARRLDQMRPLLKEKATEKWGK